MKLLERQKDLYKDFCYICGFTLSNHDLAADIAGDFVDYNKRVRGNITISICTECWQKILTNVEGGINAAKKRSAIFQDTTE